MEFRDTGLPEGDDNKALKNAFDYAHEIYHGQIAPQYVDNAMMGDNQMYAFQTAYLEKLKNDGRIDQTNFDLAKGDLDTGYAAAKEEVTAEVAKAMDEQLGVRAQIATELLASGNPSPDVAAVSFLMSTTPASRMGELEARFGKNVSDLVTEIDAIDRGLTEVSEASADAKRVSVAKLTTVFNHAAKEIKNVFQEHGIAEGTPVDVGQVLQTNPQMLFEQEIKPLWANDEKLAMRCMDAFNKLSDVCSSPHKISLDDQNQPILKKIKRMGGRNNRPGQE